MSEKREYLVRQYDPARDLEGAARCLIEGFDNILWPFWRHSEGIAEAAIEFSSRFSDRFYVAECDGEARGMLVGSYMEPKAIPVAVTSATSQAVFPFLRNRFKFQKPAFIHLLHMLRGFAPLLYKHPLKPHATETVLLASQADYRGGIGRAMMDAWIADSRKAGYDYSTVTTDTALSWGFYEKYGFDRIVEFPQKAYHYALPGEEHSMYIYRIETGC